MEHNQFMSIVNMLAEACQYLPNHTLINHFPAEKCVVTVRKDKGGNLWYNASLNGHKIEPKRFSHGQV